MNPVALIIALPILKSLFNGGSVTVSPTTTTPKTPALPPVPVVKYQDAILRETQFTQPKVTAPKPITVTDPVTNVVVPVRPLTDTPKQIAERLKYGSGL